MKRVLRRVLLPIVVLLAAIAGTVYLVASKPAVEPAEREEQVWTVQAMPVVIADIQPELSLYGQVVAGREVELRALVAGEVVDVGANVVEGGTLKRGDLVVAIDDFDYRAAVDEQSALLREAEARLQEIMARREAIAAALEQDATLLDLTQRELDRNEKLQARGTISDKAVDVARIELARQRQAMQMRQNEMAAEAARIDQQRAALDRLAVALRRAERDLANTRLMAPYDGFLVDLTAELGKRLNVNDRIAQLIDAGRLEVEVTLSDAQFGRLVGETDGIAGRAAMVIWHVGAVQFEFPATLDRVAARIDAASGGVDLYARISDGGPRVPLRPGAFIELRVKDQLYRQVVQLPESALYDRNTVYAVVDGRLVARPVELVAYRGNDVLLRGDLRPGEQIVITRHTEIGPGQRVEVR